PRPKSAAPSAKERHPRRRSSTLSEGSGTIYNVSNMDAILTADGLLALATLTFLEIVLGVDNVIFISILSSKLPEAQQSKARRTGLLAAMGMRILLLLSIA